MLADLGFWLIFYLCNHLGGYISRIDLETVDVGNIYLARMKEVLHKVLIFLKANGRLLVAT